MTLRGLLAGVALSLILSHPLYLAEFGFDLGSSVKNHGRLRYHMRLAGLVCSSQENHPRVKISLRPREFLA
jgi:hypothetical protein